MENVIKACSCCKKNHTAASWAALPFVGTQLDVAPEGTYSLELRNCACGSTLAVETFTAAV